MAEMTGEELASQLRTSISRLVKVIRSEVKHDEILSLTERSTLSLVYQYSKTVPSELAAIEKVSCQSMSQIIRKLFDLGYIRKSASVKDKRKVIISITAKGKNYIDGKRTKSKEWLAKSIAEKTTEKERKILTNAVKVLTKLID